MTRLLILIAAVLTAALAAAAQPELPRPLDLSKIHLITVQDQGRWMPLDTQARDIVSKVTGDVNHKGVDPVVMLLAWTFDSKAWMRAPLITVGNAEARGWMGLPADQEVFSYEALAGHKKFNELFDGLKFIEPGQKPDPLQSRVGAIHEKLLLLRKVFRGEAIRPIPDPENALGAWRSTAWLARSESGEMQEARQAWLALGKAFRPAEAKSFAESAASLANALEALPAAHRPDRDTLETELLYNRARPFRMAWMVMVLGTLVSVLALFERRKRLDEFFVGVILGFIVVGIFVGIFVLSWELFWLISGILPFRPPRISPWVIGVLGFLLSPLVFSMRRIWFDVLSVVVTLAGFAMLTWGLSMRWTIANRIPAANMFESLLFLSWGMGAFAVVALPVFRHRIVPLTASFMGALSLCLADSLPLDQFVRPIAPVLLDTIWMSIHVPIIMISYAILAMGVLIAHVQIWIGALVLDRHQLMDSVDRLHYWFINVGAIMLFVGIITGSIWASSSWGRYWGWDPKEVWSLVAFLGYMAILHVRIDRQKVPGWAQGLAAVLVVALFVVVVPKLVPVTLMKAFFLALVAVAMVFFVLAKSRMAVAVKSVLAFWLIIMTYVGVNYVLGIGLHSYGFGTGAVANRVFLIGGLDLSLVVVLYFIHLIRSRPRSQELPAATAA